MAGSRMIVRDLAGDGSVEVPEALRPYMGGLEVIAPDV